MCKHLECMKIGHSLKVYQIFRAEENDHGRIKVFNKTSMCNQDLPTGLPPVTKWHITAVKLLFSNLVLCGF